MTFSERRRLLFGSLALSVTLFTVQCGRTEFPRTTDPLRSAHLSGQNISESDARDSRGSISLRNFRQFVLLLTTVTGVALTEGDLNKTYVDLRNRLSLDGDPGKFSVSFLMASTHLVGAFCNQAILNEAKLPDKDRKLFPGVDFKEEATPFSAELREKLILIQTHRFWRRAPTDEEKETLLALMADIQKGTSMPQKIVYEMALSLCSAVGSSLDALKI